MTVVVLDAGVPVVVVVLDPDAVLVPVVLDSAVAVVTVVLDAAAVVVAVVLVSATLPSVVEEAFATALPPLLPRVATRATATMRRTMTAERHAIRSLVTDSCRFHHPGLGCLACEPGFGMVPPFQFFRKAISSGSMTTRGCCAPALAHRAAFSFSYRAVLPSQVCKATDKVSVKHRSRFAGPKEIKVRHTKNCLKAGPAHCEVGRLHSVFS